MADLLAHGWPGNVRELRNVVERSVARAERPDRRLERVVIDPFATGTRFASRPRAAAEVTAVVAAVETDAAASSSDFLHATRRFEAQLLRQALENNRFSQKRAASSLGLTYYQFRHHLRVHGMLTGKRQAEAEVS